MRNFLPFDLDSVTLFEELEEHFVFIGVTEHFQTSVDKLAILLQKRRVTARVTKKIERDELVDEKLRDKFVETFKKEYRLYNWAREFS